MSHLTKPHGCSQSEPGLCETLRKYGCPMLDTSLWAQSASGEVFTSPDGIGTVAYWLPCVAGTQELPLPGMCADCDPPETWVRGTEASPCVDGT